MVVEVGDRVEVGDGVEAGNTVEVGDGVEAGNAVEVGDVVEAGGCLVAGQPTSRLCRYSPQNRKFPFRSSSFTLRRNWVRPTLLLWILPRIQATTYCLLGTPSSSARPALPIPGRLLVQPDSCVRW